MSFTRRQALRTASLVGVGLAAPAIVRAQGEQPEQRILGLGFGIDPPFAPHVLGMQKGWFREAGFTEIRTQTFTAGALAGEALVAGQIHLWTPGNLPPISMVANGVPVVVIGTNCVNWDLEKLVVRNDANVNAPEDLYRIKIGLLQGSTSSAFIHYLAERYRLDAARLQLVNLPPPEQLTALTANNVQGLLCWEPWPFRAVGAGGARVVHSGLTNRFGAAPQPAKVSNNRSILVMSQDFVRRNPRTVQAVTAVMLRGARYAADPANRDEVIKLFSEQQRQDEATNRAIWGNYVFNPAFDEAYVEDMDRTASFLHGTGRIRANPATLDYSYTEPLKRIDPSLVKIEGRWRP
jgi:ABC-type nitrate/sulfonate/bicarbonate transport system substrate-binding protein